MHFVDSTAGLARDYAYTAGPATSDQESASRQKPGPTYASAAEPGIPRTASGRQPWQKSDHLSARNAEPRTTSLPMRNISSSISHVTARIYFSPRLTNFQPNRESHAAERPGPHAIP